MPSRTGYNDFKKAQFISRIQSDAAINELRRQKAKAEREAYKNSPEGKAEQKKRDLIQERTKEKDTEILAEMENLEAVLPVMISDLEQEIKEDLKNSSVNDVLEKYKNDFAEVNKKSERLLTLQRIKYPTTNFSYFAKLYYKLSLIDPQFIMFAPAKVFTSTQEIKCGYANFNLSSLTLDDLAKLYERLKKENPSISTNDHFACYYAKYFKGEINNLKSLRDVKSCLVKYPEAFTSLDSKIKYQLRGENELSYVVSKAPSVIKYMTKDEIEQLANSSLKFIASAAMKEPEILDYLDEDFFSRHDYRLCFTNYPKAKIRTTLGDKVKRHVRLQAYIYSKKEDRSLDSSLNF